ncbi:hypothetical protein ABPG74_009120 [Tetrahymena malaccensis]
MNAIYSFARSILKGSLVSLGLGKLIGGTSTIFYQLRNRLQNAQQLREKYQYFQQNYEINGRCASSLWDNFPSGIVSVFSMVLTNQCVRHEYVLIYTQDYFISAEISASKDCQNSCCLSKNLKLQPNQSLKECQKCKQKLSNAKSSACFQVMIWNARSGQQKQKIYDQYDQRFCSRVLDKLLLEENQISPNFIFPKLLKLWSLVFIVYHVSANQESQQKFYNLFLRNCKSFARSSFYFLQKKYDLDVIFESIFAIYYDTPGYLFEPIQAGVLNLTKSIQKSQNQKDIEQVLNYISEIINEQF